ncbi:17003_t:CDS:2, partial [Dentiscutata erythropus]
CNPTIGTNFSDFVNITAQLTQSGFSNKILTITAGQYPPANMNFENINFVNIQAFRLNVDTSYASAGIDQIKTIRASWNSAGLEDQKLVLGVEFGGIAEVVTSDNIRADIVNQQLHVTNGAKFTFNSEPIPDQCKNATYGYLTWTNLNLSSSSCTTNLIPSSPWLYDFLNNSKLPYLYQQYSSKFYFVVFYENYQSLNAKIDFVNSNNLAGIAIADITKDSNDLQLTNFILGTPPQPTLYNGTISNNTSPSAPTSSTPRSSSNNTGAIVGGVIGSIAFVAIVAVAGFMLYKKRRYNVRGTGGTTKAVGTVEAMFDYVGKEASDLSFRAGDKIEVLERGDGPNDWWVGRLYDRVGEFPGE